MLRYIGVVILKVILNVISSVSGLRGYPATKSECRNSSPPSPPRGRKLSRGKSENLSDDKPAVSYRYIWCGYLSVTTNNLSTCQA